MCPFYISDNKYPYRFNHRFNLAAMLPKLIKAAARTGPEWLLRLAKDCRKTGAVADALALEKNNHSLFDGGNVCVVDE